MHEQETQHYVGLDIGTSTVRCVIGSADPTDPSRPAIIGHGAAVNRGMRKGAVAHVEDVVEAVSKAVDEAERVTGFQVRSATVNVNGYHVSGINSKGVIALSTANREITQEDRLRVEEAATIVNLPPNREIIQVFAKNYGTDGQDNIKDPVGMHGVRLEVDTHIVTAATPNMNAVHTVLDKTNIQASHTTVSSLAAAEAVLSRQQKEAGTLLVDIGAGTTNMVVIEDGEVQYVGVLPVGGINLTNDLAIGLKTDLDVAERVKIEHGRLGASKNKIERVKVSINNVTHFFETDDVAMIIEARMEEIFEIVEKELKRIHKSRRLPGGVVLVGGVAKTPGIAEFATERLQLATRIGALQRIGGLADTVNDVTYTTAVGLMLLDMLLTPQVSSTNLAGGSNDRVFGVIESVIRKLRR